MTRKILFTLILFSVIPSFAALSINSLNISKNNAALEDKAKDSCKSQKDNIGMYVKCQDQLIENYQDAGLFEGTKQYAQKNYQALGSEVLHDKMKQLIELKKTARTYIDSLDDHVSGELTKEDYNSEIGWIQTELKSRHYMTPEQKKSNDWYNEHVTVINPGQSMH